MNTKNLVFVLIISFSFLSLASTKSKKSESKFICTNRIKRSIHFTVTNPDKSVLFEKQENGISSSSENNLPTIKINADKTYQEMDGFGFTLTGGSAFHINNMSVEKRKNF